MYSIPGHMVGASDFRLAYIWTSIPIYVCEIFYIYGIDVQFGGCIYFWQYKSICCEADIAVGCDLAQICISIGLICQCKMREV